MRSTNSCLSHSLIDNSKKLFYLALCLGMLTNVSPVYAEAGWVTDMEDRCEKGDTTQCLALGTAYLKGELEGRKLKQDDTKAQHWLRKGTRMGEQNCHANIAADCYAMGLAYFEGRIIQSDLPRGLELMQRGCDLKYEKACVWLHDSGITYKIQPSP